jgi:hypothetical protein
MNIAAKPSFAFAFLVAFPLAALVRFRRSRELWDAWGLTAFIAAVALLQYLSIYKTGALETIYRAAGFAGADSHIKIDPFHVWSHYSSNIPLSLAASLVFPLVALAVYRRRLVEYDLVRYAAALFAASLVIFMLFTETGVRQFHANLEWQVFVSNYILFLAVLIRVWVLRDRSPSRLATGAVGTAFATHVIAGLGFLSYWFAKGTYF